MATCPCFNVEWYFYFGAAGSPFGAPSLVTANTDYVAAAHAAGRTMMAGYTPMYWGTRQAANSRRYFEFEGGRGTTVQWENIISSGADAVELVTWNDLNESYVSPIDDFQKYRNWGGPLGWYKSHAGYAELNRYYIQWFKTQQRPTLTQDALFYFYRTHRASAVAAADPLGPVIPVGAAPDEINLTVFARSTGLTLWVNSGGAVSERALPPGLTSLSVPFGEGEQRFELRGPSRTLVATPEPVVGAITRYDFWPTSGWLEGDLGP